MLKQGWLLAAILVLSPVNSQGRSLLSAGSGPVEIDQALLDEVLTGGAQEFRLPVNGREFMVRVARVSEPNLGVTSLRGQVDGDPESFFLLCRTENGATIAFFQPGDGSAYRMDRAKGHDEVYQVDFKRLGPCGGALKPEVLGIGQDVSHSPPAPYVPIMDKAGEAADDGSRHDIIVGYTPAAEAAMGGWDFIRAEAQLAIDAANFTYLNSNIDAYLRLVHVMSTEYDETTADVYEDHVRYLGIPDDEIMDDMLAMREQVGADFVSVLIDGQDSTGDVPTCGVAPIMEADRVNIDFEAYAVSIVSVQCATDNWSLAHEVAHNRGCAHNIQDAYYFGAYPYSFGRRFVGADDAYYRTVMAYDHFQGGYERIPYFTNPDIDFAGVPTGVTPGLEGEAHNALTHDNTAALCASFRAERTFVLFGWLDVSNGLLLTPCPSIAEAVVHSRESGTIVIRNDKPDFLGALEDPRIFVHDGTGSAVLGGN